MSFAGGHTIYMYIYIYKLFIYIFTVILEFRKSM